MTMILRFAPPSPFARKVRIAASVLDLSDQITLETTDLNDPAETLRVQNPLGKIPALVLDDGTALYDSSVIVQYLDTLAGGVRIIPPSGMARFQVLRQEALADGLMDAGVLQVYEGRYRPAELHHQPWLDRQAGKVARALAAIAADPPPLDEPPHIGAIATACALGYLDFRFSGDWRAGNPGLVAWLERFEAAVPAYAQTAPE